jgi:alkanesulfonate monooxygenase SsuD/methylene tetrahydromethanopterin reductase-like flavin-dependent oxidoreductase (luciferase family)
MIASNPVEGGDPAVEERVLRRIARLADGWQTDGTPAPVFRERWSRIREYAAEAGRADQVTDASLHLMVNINDDRNAGFEEALKFLQTYYGPRMTREYVEGWLACGSPAAVVEKIRAYVEAGCTTPILRFASWDQKGQLTRALADVMPAALALRLPA